MDLEKRRTEVWTLAFSIALLQPLWAVLSGHIGVTTGAVALICAGVYSANGNKTEDALKILIGFWLGDIWAWIAVHIMAAAPLPADLILFLTLFFMGGLAVLIGSIAPRFIYTPAWLCGWAIGLTIMGPAPLNMSGSYLLQIGAAMAAGVLYVGIGVDRFQKFLMKKCMRS